MREVVEAELAAACRLDTVAGQLSLYLAGLLDNGFEWSGAEVAAVSRELRAVHGLAMAGASEAADPLDQLAQRRRVKAAEA